MRFRNLILLALMAGCNRPEVEVAKVAVRLEPYSDAAFVHAISQQDSQTIERFLSAEVNPNARNRFGDTALHWATFNGDLALMGRLLSLGSNIDLRGTDDKTPIFWAVHLGNPACVKLLLDHHASISIRDEAGNTPLHAAARSGNVEIIDMLLAGGSELELRNGQANTPLHAAIEADNLDASIHLILAGADLFAEGRAGSTALDMMVQHDRANALRRLDILALYPNLDHAITDATEVVVDNASQQPQVNLNRIAILVHEMVNEIRAQAQLSRLAYDTGLERVAAAHSEDMARNNYISHTNLAGESPTQRADAIGYSVVGKSPDGSMKYGIGENLYQGHLYRSSAYHIQQGVKHVTNNWLSEQEIARAAVEGWMDSPGHRKNILTPHYQREGVAAAFGPDGKIYLTQNLW